MDDTEILVLPNDLLDTKLPNSYLLKYYQDLEHRTFWISDEVNDELLYELAHYILKCSLRLKKNG